MTFESSQIFRQVDDKSLREQVVNNIRQAIEAGALKPGARLVETAIAEQMGTSRAPVREAIRLLEEEGFVVSIPRKGSFVIKLKRQDIEEIYTLRTALESLAVKLALPHMTPAEIDELEALVNKMRQAAEERDISQLVEWDHAFHERIVDSSHNSRLIRAWLRMSAQLRLFFSIKDQLYDNPHDVVDTHYPIIEALRAGDIELAQKTLVDHIVEAGELVLTNLDDEDFEDGTP
ncbi:MAG: GntR family transcriptional regulator [Anaerolineae bacterium]